MAKRVLILSASAYSFVDKSTGDLKEGCTVHYATPNILAPKSGANVFKVSCPIELIKQFKTAPAVYEIETDEVSGPRQQPKITIVAMQHIADVDLKTILQGV